MLKISLIVLAVLVVGMYVAATYVLPYAIVQPPRRTSPQTPEQFGFVAEQFRLPVADGIELDALFAPAAVPPRANLIMLHGVGSCKEVYLGLLPDLLAMGYNVLLWDQRAHGRSGGDYLTYGYHEKHDVSLAIDWLERRHAALPTGIYGNSMGGAVAIQSMAYNPGISFGLIESTFTDLPSVSQAYGRRLSGLPLPRWFSDYVLRRAGELAGFDPFAVRPVDAARRVGQPILHIHGDADGNIAFSNAKTIFEAYASRDKSLYVVPAGDHADLWDKGGDGYRETWYGFLRRMISAPAAGQ